MWQVTHVTCHVSRVTCHMSCVTCHIFFFYHSSPQKNYWSYDPHRSRDSVSPVCGILFFIYFFFYHSPPPKKILVLWSASVERFSVSRMRDFFLLNQTLGQKKRRKLNPAYCLEWSRELVSPVFGIFFCNLSLFMQCDRWPSTTNNQIYNHLSRLEFGMIWANTLYNLKSPHIYLKRKHVKTFSNFIFSINW